VVANKMDLPSRANLTQLEAGGAGLAVVKISAKTGEGLEELKDRIRALLLSPELEAREPVLVSHLRHQQALERARQAVIATRSSVEQQAAAELVALDLRAAIDALGEITGAVTTDDILDRIFREFCIGK
jgi:tRNA modification GTPase